LKGTRERRWGFKKTLKRNQFTKRLSNSSCAQPEDRTLLLQGERKSFGGRRVKKNRLRNRELLIIKKEKERKTGGDVRGTFPPGEAII